MRKIISIILTIMIIASLTACGTNPANSEAGATQPTTESTKEAVETTAKPEVTETADIETTDEPTETVETPAGGPYDNLEDWVIGKDIFVAESVENNALISNLPELAIKLPAKDNLLGIDEYSNANDYNIEVPTTDDFVVATASLYWAKGEDLCFAEQLHKELTTYGRYTFDWGYANNIANIAIGCPDTDTSILITLSIYKQDKTDNRKPTTDEAKAEFEKFVNLNVEYVREQVQAWDQNYVPTGELSSANVSASVDNEQTEEKELIVPEDNVEPSEEDVNSFFRTYKQVDGSCSYTFVQGDTWDDTTITANDGTNSYEFDMEILGEGIYSVTSDGVEAFQIRESWDKITVKVTDDKYSAFAGIYE